MDPELKDKVALITGGGSGIGRAIALALAEEGVHIAVASRNPDPRTIEEIKARGVKALRLCIDVSKEDQVVEMVKQTINKLGKVDLYINNAAGTWHQPITRVSTKEWLRTIHVNLSACVWSCREVSKYMIAKGGGSILIIGSTVIFSPAYKESSYRVSKTGLKAYMETLAIELAPFKIRVNMLVPGHFTTRLTADIPLNRQKILSKEIPLRRFGKPEELGPTAVLLLSDKLSPYTTGSIFVVDGGLRLRPLPMYSEEEIYQMNLNKKGVR